MALTAGDILAGPILRRVEPNLVSVWIAYKASAPLPVTLKVFKGLGGGSGAPLAGQNVAADKNPVVRAGANFFVALAMWEPAAPTQLEAGQVHSYDIEIGGTGLAALGLLKEGAITARGTVHEQLPLGYADDQLPSFLAPPATVTDLRILQGSCRSHSGNGHDAMPAIDDLIDPIHADPLKRPHMLWLTGDQIYADEAAPELIGMIAGLSAELFGHGVGEAAETLSVKLRDESNAIDYPVNVEHFPPSRRGNLLNDAAGFTSTSTEAHAMGFGEFCGMYLTAWNNIGWNWNAEELLASQLEQYRDYLRLSRKLRNFLKGDPAHPEAPVFAVSDERDRVIVARRLAEMFPFFEAWRMLPAEWRAIDRHLSDTAVEQAWGKDGTEAGDKTFEFWREFKTLISPAAGTTAPRGDAPAVPTPDPRKAKLASALTPSWYAGRKYFANRDLPDDEEKLAAIPDKFEKATFHVRIERLEWGYRELPRVRRLLANVPVYMTFDDHEITDDWNITPRWAKETRSNPLARGIIRNGLAAFTLFQGWGNDPRAYLKGTTGRKVLDDIQELFGGATAAAPASADKPAALRLEQRFDLVKVQPPQVERMHWHFTYDGPNYQFIALDTRTWRGFELNDNTDIGVGFSMDGTATLLTAEALRMQISEQPPPGIDPDGVTFLIAPAPLIGYPIVESLVQPIINLADMVHLKAPGPFERWDRSFRVGRVNRDPENWGFSPALLEAMFARLSTRARVLVLSGDVHYSFTLRMNYWGYKGIVEAPDQTTWPKKSLTRFVQMTSSSFRAQRDDLAPIVSIDLLQQLGHYSSNVRRLGWAPLADFTAPPPVKPGTTAFNFHLARTLSNTPPAASPEAIPGDAEFLRRPAWALATEMLQDNRPDRFDDLVPLRPKLVTSGDELACLQSFGEFHRWQALNTLPRHWMWWANFTEISFSGTPTQPAFAHHRTHTFDPSGEFKSTKPFIAIDIPLTDQAEASTAPPADDLEANKLFARMQEPPRREDFHP